MASADQSFGDPPGFPACTTCPHFDAGPAAVCASCVSQTLQAIASDACPVCRQLSGDSGRCRNRICRDPSRAVERIDAIAYLSGPLRSRIYQYKYQGSTTWRLVFGRLLLGWLEANAHSWPPGLIIANPTYLPPGVAAPGHIEAIIRSAAEGDRSRRWPFDIRSPAAIIKTEPTLKSSGQDTGGKYLAGVDLRDALRIPDPGRIRGRNILIFDDVCTTGSQINTLATCLRDEGGAAGVRALVLARTPWRPNSRAPGPTGPPP